MQACMIKTYYLIWSLGNREFLLIKKNDEVCSLYQMRDSYSINKNCTKNEKSEHLVIRGKDID